MTYIPITHIIREISEIFLLNYKRYNIFTEKSIINQTELCKSKKAKNRLETVTYFD